jgi:LytS/YehU family sensor histidine kinase
MLITLVENAIQHGVEPAAAGGRITIRARTIESRLAVEVVDTGAGIAPAAQSEGHGVGLDNVRQRLAALFGSEGRFRLESGDAGGAVATLEVPLVVA